MFTIFIFIFLTVIAASSVANIVKSSLGPVGLDKMIVDDVGVSILTVLHPAVHSLYGCVPFKYYFTCQILYFDIELESKGN